MAAWAGYPETEIYFSEIFKVLTGDGFSSTQAIV